MTSYVGASAGGAAPHYAIFSAHYLPNIGGIEKYTDNLARELVRRGNRVTIVTSNVLGLAEREQPLPGLAVYRLPCYALIGGRMPVPKRDASFKGLWAELCAARYDGVLINARFYLHTLLGLSLAKRAGVRPIVLDHGSAYLTFGNAVLDVAVRAYEHAMTALVKRGGADFYGVSSKSVEWLRTFGVEARGVLSNAIDADVFTAQASARDFRSELAIAPETPLIAFAGRLIPEKGVPCLLEAMRLLQEDGVGCRCAIAGDGALRTEVERAAESAGNIAFLGPLGAPDVCALFQQADMVVQPSRSEGFSTTLLEAAACGTPVVTTDVGGARELGFDQGCGVLLGAMDAREVADAVRACIDRDLKATGGGLLRSRVRSEFSWPSTAERVERAFRMAAAAGCA